MLTSSLHNKQCCFSHLAVGNDEAQTGKVVCPLPYRVSKPPALDSCCSLCLECSALSSGSLAPLGMSYVPYFSDNSYVFQSSALTCYPAPQPLDKCPPGVCQFVSLPPQTFIASVPSVSPVGSSLVRQSQFTGGIRTPIYLL